MQPLRLYKIFLFALILISNQVYAQIHWKVVQKGLEMAQVSLPTSMLFSSEILIFRANLNQLRLQVIKARDFGATRLNVKNMALNSKAVLAVNANFFDQSGNPLGLVMSRGRINNRIHNGGKTLTGILSVSNLGIIISHRSDRLPTSTLEAIQAGPRLVLNGQIVQDLDSDDRSRRTALCIDADQQLLIFVSSGVFGITFQELQQLQLSAEIKCQDGINLDGGGSSQLYLNHSPENINSKTEEIYVIGRDPVPVALGLFLPETQ